MNVPDSGSRHIPHQFLADLAQRTCRPIVGPGVVETAHSIYINPPGVTGSGHIALYELAGDLSPGGEVEAYPCWLENYNEGYKADKNHGTTTLYDALEVNSGSEGDWCYAWYDQILFVKPGGGLTPAILKDDCAPGDTAIAAYPVASDGTADTSADELSLDNTHPGNFRGYGADHTGFDETTAAKVVYASILGVNQIVSGQGVALMCRARTKAAVAVGDSSFVVNNVYPMDLGHSPVTSTTDELTVLNCSAKIGININGTIVWDESNDSYRYLDFPWTC